MNYFGADIEVDTRNPRVILSYEEKKKQIRKKIR